MVVTSSLQGKSRGAGGRGGGGGTCTDCVKTTCLLTPGMTCTLRGSLPELLSLSHLGGLKLIQHSRDSLGGFYDLRGPCNEGILLGEDLV